MATALFSPIKLDLTAEFKENVGSTAAPPPSLASRLSKEPVSPEKAESRMASALQRRDNIIQEKVSTGAKMSDLKKGQRALTQAKCDAENLKAASDKKMTVAINNRAAIIESRVDKATASTSPRGKKAAPTAAEILDARLASDRKIATATNKHSMILATRVETARRLATLSRTPEEIEAAEREALAQKIGAKHEAAEARLSEIAARKQAASEQLNTKLTLLKASAEARTEFIDASCTARVDAAAAKKAQLDAARVQKAVASSTPRKDVAAEQAIAADALREQTASRMQRAEAAAAQQRVAVMAKATQMSTLANDVEAQRDAEKRCPWGRGARLPSSLL